jgi:putative transposase
MRKSLVDQNESISIKDQCELLEISRSSIYYEAVPEFSTTELKIMNVIDEIYTAYPFYGYRRQYQEIIARGYKIGEDRVRIFMRILDLKTFYPSKTTIPNKEHKIYPYLLRNLKIERVNQVWAADITYIRLVSGFCYLVAIIDWYSRYLLSFRISNCLDKQFCLDALEEALLRYEKPDIFNTDQGSQFTSQAFTEKLSLSKIKISMDSVGRWSDNIIIERFFRSLKWENIYINQYDSVKDVRLGCADYIQFYNHKRRHETLDYQTPYTYFWSLN